MFRNDLLAYTSEIFLLFVYLGLFHLSRNSMQLFVGMTALYIPIYTCIFLLYICIFVYLYQSMNKTSAFISTLNLTLVGNPLIILLNSVCIYIYNDVFLCILCPTLVMIINKIACLRSIYLPETVWNPSMIISFIFQSYI